MKRRHRFSLAEEEKCPPRWLWVIVAILSASILLGMWYLSNKIVNYNRDVEAPPIHVTSTNNTRLARTVTITAYEAVPQQTDSSPCHDGRWNICSMLRAGINTCATGLWERGTVLEMPGLGRCVVSGVQAPKHQGKVDWFCGERPASVDCVQTIMKLQTVTAMPI
jgi:hypothetical protein